MAGWRDDARGHEALCQNLFGNCRIENLLKGTSFDGYSGCFLIRVKGACDKDNWEIWPNLIDEAMKATVETYGRPDIIQVKGKSSRVE